MAIYSALGSVFTVISFFLFIGIVFWAYSARRKQGFDEAAREPFALPDETEGLSRRAGDAEQRR